MKWAAAAYGRIVEDVFRDRAFARIRGLEKRRALTWGLRPRLYASACFAG